MARNGLGILPSSKLPVFVADATTPPRLHNDGVSLWHNMACNGRIN